MLNWLRRFYIPVFVQITLPFMLLALAVSAGATYISTSLIVESVEDRFANQLIASALQVQDSLARKEDEMLADVRLLSNIQGVAEAIEAADEQQLRTLLLPLALNEGVEYLAVISPRAEVLLSVQLAGDSGYTNVPPPPQIVSHPLVANVLAGLADAQGDKYTDVVGFPDGAKLVISGPVGVSSQVAGAILVGRPVEGLADTLRQESLGQISIYDASGQLLGSTLAQPRPLTSLQAAAVFRSQESGSLVLPIQEDSISYNEINSVWQVRNGQPEGVVGVALASNFLLQATQFTRNNALLLTSASSVLVVLVGLWLAGSITRPISELKTAAQRAAGGNLNVSVPIYGQDEIGVLAESFNDMMGNLSQSKQELLHAYEKTIEGWAKATDLRDHETEDHSRRVAELSVALARSMGWPEADLVNLRRGALLHDIGKIGIPDAILLKPGKLSEDEWVVMRKHPEYARSFIEQVDFLNSAMVIPYSHHERWNGSGYPQGLKGEDIPAEARIFAVVDVWDALTSDRPYRKALSASEALDYILSESGTLFDPQVVAAFQKLLAESKTKGSGSTGAEEYKPAAMWQWVAKHLQWEQESAFQVLARSAWAARLAA